MSSAEQELPDARRPPITDPAAQCEAALSPAEAALDEMAGLLGQLDRAKGDPRQGESRPPEVDTVWIWGLPLARLTFDRTLDLVDRLIDRRRPGFFITANLHYAMLTDRDPRLPAVNQRASFIVADGMPMVWYSRLTGRPLPERVAGSDLVHGLCRRAAKRGHRLFLLGGQPGVAREAAAVFTRRYPALRIVDAEAPMLAEMTPQEHAGLVARIRQARPDILLVAFGQPKGELWLAEHCGQLEVPVCAQVGASFDFVSGRVRRAPPWIQRIGMEWMYRLAQEPKRMGPRYLRDAMFLGKAVFSDLVGVFRRQGPKKGCTAKSQS